MKNIKKTLVMCVSLVLIAVMAIGGTVAYLTVDPIEKGNVFSVGNIAINLTEDVGTTGAATVTSDDNGATYTDVMPGDYLKKEVAVENTGKRPAYVAVEVTINNALEINKAIDEFYEAKGYSEAEIQAIYDYIFEGFGMNYTKTDANGNATGMRLTITGDKMPEKALQVDSVKTISEYWQQYSGNWFLDEKTNVAAIGDAYDGYYTTGMNDYELRYTYYLLLEAGEKSTLFKGFNVPKEFNAQQLDMFNGLNIDIIASAIQADNFADAKTAFSTLKNEIVWQVKDAASLAKALKKGGKIKLADNITNTGDSFMVPAGVNVELDLNGKTVTAGSDGYAFYNENGGTLIINDSTEKGSINGVVYTGANSKTVVNDGTFNAANGGSYVFLNSSGSLTINGGVINGGGSYPIYSYNDGHELVINDATVNATFGCINAYGLGTVTVNDGEFKMTGVSGKTSHLVYVSTTTNMTINGGTFAKIGDINMSASGGGGICTNGSATLTINDGNFSGAYRDLYVWNSNSKIIVKGGTYKFNPTSEGAKVADGYKLTQNGDGTWSVGPAKADSNASLEQAIKDGETVIELPAGDFVIPAAAAGKNLTIIGNGDTKVAVQNTGSYEGCDYSLQGSNVTFENVVITTDSHAYVGYAGLSATYNNCTFNGTYNLYGDSVFNNCVFNISGDNYNLWTWSAKNVTLNNCTFNSDGKAILLYGGTDTKLEVNGCVFNDKGGLTDLKAAIEIGNDYGRSYQLIVNNTVVNGYEINDKGINTGTTLWGNKNSMGTDKLNVIVDGVDVY